MTAVGAVPPTFSLCWVLPEALVLDCLFQKEVTGVALPLPQGRGHPLPAAQQGPCLSQTCQGIRGFQMQLSCLDRRRLRDEVGVAPRGQAATCQGDLCPREPPEQVALESQQLLWSRSPGSCWPQASAASGMTTPRG